MRSELLIPKTCGERIAAKVRFMELDDEKRRLQTQETLIEDPNQSASFAGEATSTDNRGQDQSEGKPPLNQADIFKALEVVERDSVAIAESFTSLFSSLRLALSEVTHCSTDHMQCFNDAAGHLQESVLDAATKGNRYINSCLRLNEELKGIDTLATQLKILRRNVDALDSAVNKLVRLP